MATRTKPKKKEIIPAERALTVVEPEPEIIPEPVVPYAPTNFEIYPITEDGVVPNSKSIYYPLAKEGFYLYRPLLIGHGYIPQKDFPKSNKLKSIGDHSSGLFEWVGPPIPADICAQIVHLFRRILTKQRTEAEVILLLNRKTMEWKIWIPAQKVNYSGVTSVYDPEAIPKDYVVVGSMHSHCDFGAFHSGTDTGDARQFDGIHLTIGKLDQDVPEVAAMVMMNKVQFNYSDVSMVADFSNLDAATAPEFWDEWIADKDHEPRDNDLFTKYPVTSYTTYTPPKTSTWQPYAYDFNKPNSWTPKYPPHKSNFQYTGSDLSDTEWDTYFKSRYPDKKDQRALWEKPVMRDPLFDEDYWEDSLPNDIAKTIIISNVLSERDIDYVTDHFNVGSSPLFWRNLFLTKLAAVATTLNELGITVDYQINTKKIEKKEK